MIKYMINTPYGSNIFKTNQIVEMSSKNNLSIIKQICLQNLFTYEGYIKAVTKIFSKKYNIPVYIDQNHMFIPIRRVRDYENTWINYATVLTYEPYENQVLITFKDYDRLIINMKYNLFHKRVETLNKIINYTVKINEF
ncbi:MAG: competence protein ComK [Acholeplasmataceae bacterium]